MGRKIGVYGGTFDPIHLGHIMVAVELQEAHELDEVLFVPAKVNPLKNDPPIISAQHRLNLLEIALQNLPKCHISTLELERAAPSYMIDTIKALKASSKVDNTYYLLLGEDSVNDIVKWKDVYELLSIAKPLIARRSAYPKDQVALSDATLVSLLEQGMTRTSLFDISATVVRKRLQEGLFCGHLLNQDCLNYIYTNGLYDTDKK